MDTSAPSLILIVDDETKIRRIVASNLERAGYDVISAADGMHALEILELQSPKPALVLMDVMMPEMDGFECACRIRELGETPIIFMTAKADSNSKLKGFNLGADDYVCKPFSMEELLARIKAVLRRTQAKNNSSASEFTWLVNGSALKSGSAFSMVGKCISVTLSSGSCHSSLRIPACSMNTMSFSTRCGVRMHWVRFSICAWPVPA